MAKGGFAPGWEEAMREHEVPDWYIESLSLIHIFRGFSKALEGKKEADAADIVAALQKGVEGAYKAVMKPTEGTIPVSYTHLWPYSAEL